MPGRCLEDFVQGCDVGELQEFGITPFERSVVSRLRVRGRALDYGWPNESTQKATQVRMCQSYEHKYLFLIVSPKSKSDIGEMSQGVM